MLVRVRLCSFTLVHTHPRFPYSQTTNRSRRNRESWERERHLRGFSNVSLLSSSPHPSPPPTSSPARPCPFHYKRLCFFADSCNFLHNATSRPIPMQNSPQNRSPRFANLLFALKDVIGQDHDDLDDSFDDSLRQSSSSDHPPACSFQNTTFSSFTVCDPNEADSLSSADPLHPLLPKFINEISHGTHAAILTQNLPRSVADGT
jgi:hypothetical protein